MAKRGRPPKPAPEPSPETAVGPPRMPQTVAVDAVASAEWDRVTALLGDKATALDAGILTAYCCAYSMLVYARREIAPAAHEPDATWILTTSTGAGGTKLHPLVGQINNAARDLARYADSLGLTPMSRSRSGQAPPAAGDDLDAFLAGGP